MSVAIADFWRLLAESRLLAPQQVEQLAADYGHAFPSAAGDNGQSVADWLVGRNVLSQYQARILLAGRAGPFYYGEYKVYDRVEKGRLAGQFRAVHAPTGHPVLLQFHAGAASSDPNRWAAAVHETLAACAVVSPYVQRYFEPVDLQTFKFVVSEDLRGATLDERLAVGRFPPDEACRIVRLAAIGLAQMHQAGRVHGDVRPANLLLEPVPQQPGNLKLLFVAHETQGPIDFTQQQPGGRLALAADYVAPELMTPGRVPDPLTDIYALGCTLYEMLSGSPPFAGGTIQQKMARHAGEPIRPLEAFGVPQPLAQLVAYLMAKNPAVRYQSAAIVAEQIAAFVDPAAFHALPPAPPATLPGYEHYLRHKQGSLAVQASLPVGTAVAPSFAPAPATSPSPPRIDIPESTRPKRTAEEVLRRREKEQRQRLIVGLVGAGVLAIAAIVGFNMFGRSNEPTTTVATRGGGDDEPIGPIARPPETETLVKGNVTPPGKSGDGSTTTAAVQTIVPDDGHALWASPTSGEPVSLRCVPPEGQVFLIVRPADMLASEEGSKVLAALGPAFQEQRAAWEAASGFALDQIERLTISLHNNDATFPRASFVVETKEPLTAEGLLAKWGNPSAVKEKSETYYQAAEWAYYIPPSPEDERTFAMGQERDMKEVAAAGGNPPRLFRDMERLRRTIDGDRHFTVLFFPQFLFNDDGAPLFAAERAKVKPPLAWFLGDRLQAAAASLHFGETFYAELRMLGTLDNEPSKLAEDLRDRLNEVPRSLEDYFVTLTPPPYWKKLAFRYPGMIGELHRQTRVGVENEQAVVNCVLPAAAAHNLVLGGELLVATAPGQSPAVAAAQPPPGPKTIDEALQLKTSYSFDSQSLEFAMRDLAADVRDQAKNAPFEFQIRIIGGDLEKDGITRNQTIRDFKQDNQTVAEILTALVRKANPITTVQDPSEANQKLIWVVGPDPEDAGKQVVLITTRAAAAAKNYKLPPPFVPKDTNPPAAE